MNQLLEICFSVGPTYNNQDNQYAANYSTGYGYGYNSRYWVLGRSGISKVEHKSLAGKIKENFPIV